MTADEYADTAAEQLYTDGTPTASRIRDALADAWRAGNEEGHAAATIARHDALWKISTGSGSTEGIIEGDRGLTAWNADE